MNILAYLEILVGGADPVEELTADLGVLGDAGVVVRRPRELRRRLVARDAHRDRRVSQARWVPPVTRANHQLCCVKTNQCECHCASFDRNCIVVHTYEVSFQDNVNKTPSRLFNSMF